MVAMLSGSSSVCLESAGFWFLFTEVHRTKAEGIECQLWY